LGVLVPAWGGKEKEEKGVGFLPALDQKEERRKRLPLTREEPENELCPGRGGKKKKRGSSPAEYLLLTCIYKFGRKKKRETPTLEAKKRVKKPKGGRRSRRRFLSNRRDKGGEGEKKRTRGRL